MCWFMKHNLISLLGMGMQKWIENNVLLSLKQRILQVTMYNISFQYIFLKKMILEGAKGGSVVLDEY